MKFDDYFLVNVNTKKEEMKINDFEKEDYLIIRLFFCSKLLPLCGMNNNDIEKINFTFFKSFIRKKDFKNYFFDEEHVVIFYDNNNCIILDGVVMQKDDSDSEKLFESITNSFFNLLKINENDLPSNMILKNKNKTNSSIINFLDLNNSRSLYYENLFNDAVEKGICSFLSKNSSNMLIIEKVLSVLESWSLKTYEGHKVCYGLLVDNALKSKNIDHDIKYTESFIDFLNDEYSATLSDGISSIFRIDSLGNFEGYESIYDGKVVAENIIKDSFLPYRFFEIIHRYVINEVLGIFLLQNGDIIIAIRKEIRFIKRNGKWMNFSQFSFASVLKNECKIKTYYLDNEFFKNIYTATIDVSLSHTGGIIALVDDKNKNFLKIINRIDKLNRNEKFENLYFKEFNDKYKALINQDAKLKNAQIELAIYEKNKEKLDNLINNIEEFKILSKDIIKRLTKRKYLMKMINKKKFVDLDRKLRAELIGLDGACIVNYEGKIVSFGAIITNDAGSSGGGRGAATKKLSNFSGFAIKISTDGYIEVYSDMKRVYSIK